MTPSLVKEYTAPTPSVTEVAETLDDQSMIVVTTGINLDTTGAVDGHSSEVAAKTRHNKQEEEEEEEASAGNPTSGRNLGGQR